MLNRLILCMAEITPTIPEKLMIWIKLLSRIWGIILPIKAWRRFKQLGKLWSIKVTSWRSNSLFLHSDPSKCLWCLILFPVVLWTVHLSLPILWSAMRKKYAQKNKKIKTSTRNYFTLLLLIRFTVQNAVMQ